MGSTMSDLSKLSNSQKAAAEVLPSVENKLREAHKLIREARAFAADIVNAGQIRRFIADADQQTLDTIAIVSDQCDFLRRKARS